jgi:hypothetical protein
MSKASQRRLMPLAASEIAQESPSRSRFVYSAKPVREGCDFRKGDPENGNSLAQELRHPGA